MRKKTTLYCWFCCAAALCLMVGSGGAAVAADAITSDVKVTPQRQLSDAENRALSQAASRILVHVNQARKEIKKNELNAANDQVAKALTLVKIIENAAPTYEVAATIKSGDTTYVDKRMVEQLVVPIFTELEEVESILPGIKQAKLEAASKTSAPSPNVVDMALVFTKASLDVGEAKLDLQKAAEALNEKNADVANQRLADIQNKAVSFEYDEWDYPVVKARSNLWEALKSVQRNEWNKAKAYVKDAADTVELLKDKGGKELSDKVKAMTDQLSALTKKLDEKKDSVKTDILSLWDKLTRGL
jgi:cellobiose-specific phosphotransferase system component IIA